MPILRSSRSWGNGLGFRRRLSPFMHSTPKAADAVSAASGADISDAAAVGNNMRILQT
jgi:hypothetical protein